MSKIVKRSVTSRATEKLKKINKNGRLGKALSAASTIVSFIPAPGMGIVSGALAVGASILENKVMQPRDLRDDEEADVKWELVSDEVKEILKTMDKETTEVAKELNDIKSAVQSILEIAIDIRYRVPS